MTQIKNISSSFFTSTGWETTLSREPAYQNYKQATHTINLLELFTKLKNLVIPSTGGARGNGGWVNAGWDKQTPAFTKSRQLV